MNIPDSGQRSNFPLSDRVKNALIINGHQPFPTSTGRLNASFVALAEEVLKDRSLSVRRVLTADAWDVDQEVENQLWADLILVQFPLNSMSIPWSMKRYFDEVYTAGMDGRLAHGDGRSRADPSKQYGSGGLLNGRHYMLSVTANAPRAAFADPEQKLFAGRTLDELLAPVHINFAFFGLSALPTFSAYDVSKAPEIVVDFDRFRAHLNGAITSLKTKFD